MDTAKAITRRAPLSRARAMPAPVRHACSAGMVGAMAVLPLAGLPVVPQGRPFLLVLGILGAVLVFGRGGAVSAALVAAGLGTALLLPGADAVRGLLSVLAFLMVALGVAVAAEAMRRIFVLMEAADVRRAARRGMPARAMSAPPGALSLLAMSPEARRRRFERR